MHVGGTEVRHSMAGLSRRSRPAIFLDGGGAERLVARGVSADTVRRFLDVVRRLGLGSPGTAIPQATVEGPRASDSTMPSASATC